MQLLRTIFLQNSRFVADSAASIDPRWWSHLTGADQPHMEGKTRQTLVPGLLFVFSQSSRKLKNPHEDFPLKYLCWQLWSRLLEAHVGDVCTHQCGPSYMQSCRLWRNPCSSKRQQCSPLALDFSRTGAFIYVTWRRLYTSKESFRPVMDVSREHWRFRQLSVRMTRLQMVPPLSRASWLYHWWGGCSGSARVGGHYRKWCHSRKHRVMKDTFSILFTCLTPLL